MSTPKLCADFLRQRYAAWSGGKLKSGHAHELVAAYFGYGTAAALQAEVAYPLSRLEDANVLIPDVGLIDRRIKQLKDLPGNLPSGSVIADELSNHLKDEGHFGGEVWRETAEDYIRDTYLNDNVSLIEDELSGVIAGTNAFFDEFYVEDVKVAHNDDSLVAVAKGQLNGETHQDRMFSGDKIAVHAVVTLPRAAGKTGFFEPELEASGAVDDEGMYDPE